MPKPSPATVRRVPEGLFPLVDIQGPVAEAGRSLGYLWQDTLMYSASRCSSDIKPWWTCQPYRRLVSRYAPYLPAFYESMAKAANVPLWAVGVDMEPSQHQRTTEGCTSFAIQPGATLDRVPISGQTKDTPISRVYQYQVLRLKLSDGPSHLSLTYAGWLFGHGFITGGCAIFRNALYTPSPDHGLEYPLFGLIALHCPSVEDVIRIARDHGVRTSAHVVVADEAGNIAGLELTHTGTHVLKPRKGIYTHANCVFASKKDLKRETPIAHFSRKNSLCRPDRMRELLEANQGHLTAQQAMYALADGLNDPEGICRNLSDDVMTTAAIVAQPTRGLLHVTRGNPAQNWTQTYSL